MTMAYPNTTKSMTDQDDDELDSIERSLASDVSFSTDKDSSSKPEDQSSTNIEPTLAAKETQIITWSKILVAFVLLVATGIGAFVTYQYTTNQEEQTFRNRVRPRCRSSSSLLLHVCLAFP
jgi:hypothetical protein